MGRLLFGGSMRTIRLDIEYPSSNRGGEVLTFEVEDDATEESISQDAQTEFYNRCNFGWSEVDPEDAVQ